MALPRLKRKTRLTADLARTISVDRANSRVGIGSTIPKTKLDVGGDINTTEIFTTNISVESANDATSIGSINTINSTGLIRADSFTGNTDGLSGIAFTSIAIVYDEKGAEENGGTFTSGAWRTRDLNTISYTGGAASTEKFVILSSNSNQFDLDPGSYIFEWKCPANTVDSHKSRLKQVGVGATGTNELYFYGTNNYSQDSSSYPMGCWSVGIAYTTIDYTGYYTLQHICNTGSLDNDSFGHCAVYNNFETQVNDDTIRSIYSIITIKKF